MQRAVALYTIAAVCTLCSSAAYGQEGASTVLTESTFERLTQAAGGQTAGIWCDYRSQDRSHLAPSLLTLPRHCGSLGGTAMRTLLICALTHGIERAGCLRP